METKGKFKVVFEGFQNEQQAREFAQWYSGSGEQDSGIWLEEHSDVTGAYVEKINKVNENNEIIVPLKIYKKL